MLSNTTATLSAENEELLKRVMREEGLTASQAFDLLWSFGVSVWMAYREHLTGVDNICFPKDSIIEATYKIRMNET